MENGNLTWAKETIQDENQLIHKDEFGNILRNGDKVVIAQTLDEQGANISAKKGVVCITLA